ncbi:hypothetical protein [Albidovulum sp.]
MRLALFVLVLLAVLAARLRAEESGAGQDLPAGISCCVLVAPAAGGRT